LDSCFRLMVMLDVTTGLRRSELFALKWLDVDFSNLTIDVQRSIYLGKIGTCKTEASRKPVPLDDLLMGRSGYIGLLPSIQGLILRPPAARCRGRFCVTTTPQTPRLKESILELHRLHDSPSQRSLSGPEAAH
jgi:integrase